MSVLKKIGFDSYITILGPVEHTENDDQKWWHQWTHEFEGYEVYTPYLNLETNNKRGNGKSVKK